jgi:methionyl aminopeptidase
MVGHGIGRKHQEGPEVPNYGRRGAGAKLKIGMVIAIEPMINLGVKQVMQSNDGWTILTKDRMPSAHFEHTVAIGKEKADILSDHAAIERAIKNNKDLKEISKKN